MLGGAPKELIGYQFTTDRITLLSFTLHNKTIQNPPKTGTVELDVLPPDRVVIINAFATGSGTGSLQLTYKGKKVLDQEADFDFTHGQGFITQPVTIPQ
ncbi:MAG: hypothetical protein ABWZ25_15080 [Chitinophagaceae bacterium]